MPVGATFKEGMLDCQLMDAESPTYAIVRQHYLFAGLEQNDFDTLAASVTPKQIEKGEILSAQGECEAAMEAFAQVRFSDAAGALVDRAQAFFDEIRFGRGLEPLRDGRCR